MFIAKDPKSLGFHFQLIHIFLKSCWDLDCFLVERTDDLVVLGSDKAFIASEAEEVSAR